MPRQPFQLPYDGELTDAQPLVTTQYSKEWLPFLLGLVKSLYQVELWEPGTDMDAVSVQVDDLLARLMGVEGLVPVAYPSAVVVPAVHLHNSIVPTVLAYNSSHAAYSYVYQVTAYTSSVAVAFETWLPAGDYLIQVRYMKGSNRGKFRPQVLGVQGSYFTSVDGYASGEVYDQLAEWEYTVTTGGPARVGVKTDGKNVLSSDYYVTISSVAVFPVSGEF